MSCMLRVSGVDLDVDAMLSHGGLSAESVRRKGHIRGMKGQLHARSGAHFVISEADFDQFNRQLDDATAFLGAHREAIDRMVYFPGVDSARLDFAVAIAAGHLTQFSYLPPEFIRLAAACGLGIEISHYLCADEHLES